MIRGKSKRYKPRPDSLGEGSRSRQEGTLGSQAPGPSRQQTVLVSSAANVVLEDVLRGTPLVFFSAGGGDCVQLFARRTSGGKILSFQPAEGGKFTDLQTASLWNIHGSCISGELAGTQLTAIPHYNKIFWFVWSDFHSSTGCYGITARVGRPA